MLTNILTLLNIFICCFLVFYNKSYLFKLLFEILFHMQAKQAYVIFLYQRKCEMNKWMVKPLNNK